MKKRLLSIVLALSLVLGMLPMTAFAAGEVAYDSICVAGHIHTDDCLKCNHNEHTDACYETGSGEWVACSNPEHWNGDDHQIVLGDGCWLGGILYLLGGGKYVSVVGWNVLDYFTYELEDPTTEPICDHKDGHKDSCYKDSETADQGHKWDAGVVTAPTCTKDGYTTYTCSACGNYSIVAGEKATDHDWNDATCTEPKTCKNGCGATDGRKLGHSFTNYVSDGNATCTVDGTKTAKCDRCDATDTIADVDSKLGHNWGEWNVTEKPTAEKTGKAERVCQRNVDHVETKELPALNDKDAWTYNQVKAANCVEKGSATYTLVGDETIVITVEIPTNDDHDMGEWETTPGETCTEAGSKTRACKRNGCKYSETEEVEAVGHTWSNWTVEKEPTVDTKGEAKRVCSNKVCTETKELPALNDKDAWTYNQVKAANCVEEGSATYTLVGDETIVITVEIPTNDDHDMGEWETTPGETCTEAGSKTRACKRNGCKYSETEEVEAVGHTWSNWTVEKEPTVDTKGEAKRVCSNKVCTETKELPALNDKDAWTYNQVKAANCVEEGSATYTLVDDETIVITVKIPTNDDHDLEYHEAKDPTCTAIGWEAYQTCKREGCNYTTYKEILATGHDYDAVVTAPTCTEGGYTTYTCACGDSYVADETDALGHAWDDGVVTTAPTCTVAGEKTFTCERGCTKTESVAAAGHSYESEVTAPTCTEDGFATYTCSNCKDSYVVTKHEHTAECYKTCDGAADTTHEHGPKCYVAEWNEKVLGDGWFTCPRILCLYCATEQPTFSGSEMIDAYFDNTAVDLIPGWLADTAQYHPVRPTAAACDFESTHTHTAECGKCAWEKLGHDMVTDPAKEPTCTETGLTEGAHCSRCDKATTAQEKVPALGHEAGDAVMVSSKAPDCTTGGHEQYEVKCTRCKTVLDRYAKLIPATGHNRSELGYVAKEPDCVNEGVAHHPCTNEGCNYIFEEKIPALGHKAGEAVLVDHKDPDCTTGGNEQYEVKCTRCETVLDRYAKLIPATGHDYEGVVTAPTCTDGGYTTYTCKNDASHTYVADETAALGHDMGEWYVSVQPTYTKVGEERRDCQRENCEYFETREIAKKNEPITPVGPAKPEVTTKYLNTKDHVAYIIGYTDGTVRPNGNITRAEIATIYFRLLTEENREQFWATENGFADVNANDWFNLAVSTLDNAGVIVDVKDGNFRPNDSITRAELAVMAAQFCKVTGKLPKTSFSDLDKDYWAYDEIALIEYAGWINGYPDGTFRPDNTITRAEAMTIINRMLERAVEEENMLDGMMSFVDCPSNEWFYEAVQEATNSHNYKRSKEKVGDYNYKYEIWTELMEAPNWAAMEQAWIAAR